MTNFNISFFRGAHSGYPLMFTWNYPANILNHYTPYNYTHERWGLFHEIGHNFQLGAWLFDGTKEVMNISYFVQSSVYAPCMDSIFGKNHPRITLRFDKGFNNLRERTSHLRHFYLARGAKIRT